MRMYSVKVRNSSHWFSRGKLEADVVVLSDNIMDALVKADGVVAQMRERRAQAGYSDVDDIRVHSIQEGCSVIDGLGIADEHDIENLSEWLDKEQKHWEKESK